MKRDKRNSFVQLLFVRDMIQHCKNVIIDLEKNRFFIPELLEGPEIHPLSLMNL